MPRPALRPGYDPAAWARRWARLASACLVVGFFVEGAFEHHSFLDATLVSVEIPPQNQYGVWGRGSGLTTANAFDVLPLVIGIGVFVASFLAGRKSLGPVLFACGAAQFAAAAAALLARTDLGPPFGPGGFFLPTRDLHPLAWAQLLAASGVAAGVHVQRHSPASAGARILARWSGAALLATGIAYLPAAVGAAAWPVPWNLVEDDALVGAWRVVGMELVFVYGALGVLGGIGRPSWRGRVLSVERWMGRVALFAYPLGGLVAGALVSQPRGLVADLQNQVGFDLLYVGQIVLLPLGLAAILERRRAGGDETVADVFR